MRVTGFIQFLSLVATRSLNLERDVSKASILTDKVFFCVGSCGVHSILSFLFLVRLYLPILSQASIIKTKHIP